MPLGLLWLGLSLLGALQTQAQDNPSTQSRIPAPSLLRVPLQPDFDDDQFQGKWYILGVAGNNFRKKDQGQLKMYTTIYDLKGDQSYNVTSILLRNERCDYWVRTFVPSFLPGQFNLGNIKRYPGLLSYTMRVASTDYTQFALVFFKKADRRQEHFKVTLYARHNIYGIFAGHSPAISATGRTKELTPELKRKFIQFAKSLGLTDDYIVFPVPIDQCIDGQ